MHDCVSHRCHLPASPALLIPPFGGSRASVLSGVLAGVLACVLAGVLAVVSFTNNRQAIPET